MSVNKATIKNIPNKPGVYLFRDAKKQILYVGKAKDLKKRLNSYFQNANSLALDKIKMVNQAKTIDYILTTNELEALLLESNLIKQHRPKYNVILKDDKNYKYIKIDYQDNFPKIYSVRKIEKGPAQYFGPFTDGYAVNQTLDLLQKIFKYRDCEKDLNKKFGQRECLKYHIKRCLAPCIGKVTKEEYDQTIRQCELFLKGKQNQIAKNLEEKMKQESANKNFERAAKLRDRLKDINTIIKKQIIISTKQENQDYISLYRKDTDFIINLFIVREGKLIGKEDFLLKADFNTNNSELLESFIKQYYQKQTDRPKELILPETINDQDLIEKWLKLTITIPSIGKKKQMLDLGIKNAIEYSKRKFDNSAVGEKISILSNLQKILNLNSLPNRIECYDISNIQGKEATGSMVVFQNGFPSKKEYRLFKIKTVFQANDVAMIKEVLERRVHNSWPSPNLIIIDGGKPQINAALQVLGEHNWQTSLISLAKRFEEIHTLNNQDPIKLPAESKELHLLQQIRDEAHRFAITYHKKLRSKKSIISSLDEIQGLGPKYKKSLLLKFGNIENIKNASLEELTKASNKKIAQLIKQNLS
ncbi:MAG: excinuclease ABC subunit UvrC [Patescibacteria group bacterium]|nr:excinuclease ABC subunit UvrC [Patescibacteria group bacterium]